MNRPMDNQSKLGLLVGCEGLEPHLLHRPHVDSIDLDSQPTRGMRCDKY